MSTAAGASSLQKMDENTAETTAAAMLLPRMIPVWSLNPLLAVLSLAGPLVDGVTATMGAARVAD
jgi:hypothetical protein